MQRKRAEVDAVTRRRFMGAGLVAAAMVLAPGLAQGHGAAAARSLAFLHTHTGERLTTVYWSDGRYLPESLSAIDRLLRDFRTGEQKPIEIGLLDLLHELQRRMDSRTPFEVISGYRSPVTNAMLASHGSGVAKKSLHMRGMAVDVRLPGRDLGALRAAALRLRRGGVGYYPESDFVHLDVGRVRSW